MMPNNEQPQIDIQAVYHSTRLRFLSEARKQITIQERIERYAPYFLFVVQLVFFALSAVHTANMVERIAPPLGFLAPIGLELGLLLLAMLSYSAKLNGQHLPQAWLWLEYLLFAMTLIANFAGSLIAAMSQAESASTLSAGGLLDKFGGLPLVDQLTLIMAIVFSFAIPIGSIVIGQAIAHLVFSAKHDGDSAEQRWRLVEYEEIVKAYFQAYVQKGWKPSEAKRQALQMASGIASPSSDRRLLPSGTTAPDSRTDAPNGSDKKQTGADSKSDASRTNRTDTPNASLTPGERARQWVEANGADHTVSEVVAGASVSRDTAAKALREAKAVRQTAEQNQTV